MKDDRELESLGRVRRHQRDRHVGFVLVRVGDQGGMIDELANAVRSLLVVIHRGVDQLLQVFQTASASSLSSDFRAFS